MRICIIGLGLIGGSMAWQLKAKGHTIVGVARRQATLDIAIREKLIDESYLEICHSALFVDMVIIALPLELIVPAVVLVDKYLKAPAIVLDVGSVKSEIMTEIKAQKLTKALYIGGHPMAGSEKTGIMHCLPDLFVGKPFVICYPDFQMKRIRTQMMMQFVKDLGAHYLELSAEEHDSQVATISHLPYISANVLYKLYAKNENSLKLVASTGFTDSTRIAHSDPWWGAMVSLMNRRAIMVKLDQAIAELSELKSEIVTEDVEALYSRFNIDKLEVDTQKMELVKKWVRDYDKRS